MNLNEQVSRRKFLAVSTATAAVSLVNPVTSVAQILGRAKGEDQDPHFFMHIFLPGGLDFHSMFDSRPLEMTKAGLIHDPMGVEPLRITGTNGGSAFVTELTSNLRSKFADRFSVLNGVMMQPGFNGHPENVAYSLTGNAFGGAAMLPSLRAAKTTDTILDSFFNAPLFGVTVNNIQNSMALNAGSLPNLKNLVSSSKVLKAEHPLFQYLVSRFEAAQTGGGYFGQGSGAFAMSLKSGPAAAKRIQDIHDDPNTKDPDERFLKMACEIFKSGTSHSCLYTPTLAATVVVDTHDPAANKATKASAAVVASKIELAFKVLSETPYDDSRSMFDMTTVMFSTEFGRTMRQIGHAIDNTGTDHNQFCNSVLLAGRGIKPGLIVGASDFTTSTETLSRAHTQVDESRIRVIGRPFDFENGVPRADLPSDFKISDYLTFSSVANTLMKLYGVSDKEYWIAERNGPPASVVKQVLA